MSVPHMPQASTLMTASPAPGVGSSIRLTAILFGFSITTAFI
jgi:hypothetical protein